VDVPDLAERALIQERPRLLHERIEPRHEVRAMDDPRRVRELDQLSRLGRRQGERFLADNVLASRKRLLHLRVVQVVRRRQVHDVDAVVLEQLTQAPVHVAEPCFGSSIRARADDAEHVDAEPPQRIDMNGRDEAGADERRG
jgi:hypothetical protein